MGHVLSQNDQLPTLSHALGGSTSQPIPSFSRLNWQASLIQHLPLCHFDFHGTCACLPLIPYPIWHQKWKRGLFFLFNYLTSFSHVGPIHWCFQLCTLSVKSSPCHHLGQWGRLPHSPDYVPVTLGSAGWGGSPHFQSRDHHLNLCGVTLPTQGSWGRDGTGRPPFCGGMSQARTRNAVRRPRCSQEATRERSSLRSLQVFPHLLRCGLGEWGGNPKIML